MPSPTSDTGRAMEEILAPAGFPWQDPRALDGHLRRLLGCEPALSLRLGEVLGPLYRREGFCALGFVRFADYCREDLGLGDRTARNLVRLAEGVAKRPALRAAYLEGRLPEGHALLLAGLPAEGDFGPWIEFAEAATLHELREALRRSEAGREAAGPPSERWHVLEVEVPGELYAGWLTASELAGRLHGRAVKPFEVLETVCAEFLAGVPGEAVRAEGAAFEIAGAAGPGAPPLGPGVRGRATWESQEVEDPDGGRTPDPSAGRRAAPFPDAPPPPRSPRRRRPPAPTDLPKLLRPGAAPGPRKAAKVARRLVALKEGLEVQVARCLHRLRFGGMYRSLGFRLYSEYASSLGLARSTAEAWADRGRRLASRPEVARALEQGRVSATHADLVDPLLDDSNGEAWLEYAEGHTCRRLEETVQACRVMAATRPLAWARRGKLPPGEGESLLELRAEADLPCFEEALDGLASALLGAGEARAGGVGDSSDPCQAFSTAGAAEGGVGDSPGPCQTFSSAGPGDGTGSDGPHATGRASCATAPTVPLRILLPASLYSLLEQAEASMRRLSAQDLSREDCLRLLLVLFARHATPEEQRMDRKRREALERAGYRCEAPGCSSRRNLHVHHVVFRSRGGGDSVDNYCVTCAGHHHRHIHAGRMSVEGEGPETRLWGMGLENGDPYRIYEGDRLVYEWDDEVDGDRVCERGAEYRVAA